MKKENKNHGLIIALVVVAIMLFPIILGYFEVKEIDGIGTNETLSKMLEDKESFVLFIGDPTESETRKLSKLAGMKSAESLIDYNVYKVGKDFVDDNIKKYSVVVYIDGDIQKTYKEFNYKKLVDDVNAYYLGVYNKNNTKFKVADNYSAYKKIVKSDKVTMAVFGRNSCGWCNKFKPVYNAIAEKYKIDIYYFDSDSYKQSEYTKIVNMNLVVPAKCSSDEKEFKLSDGFGTPLTIFTRNGEIVDCISGYTDRASLIEILKDNSIISE